MDHEAINKKKRCPYLSENIIEMPERSSNLSRHSILDKSPENSYRIDCSKDSISNSLSNGSDESIQGSLDSQDKLESGYSLKSIDKEIQTLKEENFDLKFQMYMNKNKPIDDENDLQNKDDMLCENLSKLNKKVNKQLKLINSLNNKYDSISRSYIHLRNCFDNMEENYKKIDTSGVALSNELNRLFYSKYKKYENNCLTDSNGDSDVNKIDGSNEMSDYSIKDSTICDVNYSKCIKSNRNQLKTVYRKLTATKQFQGSPVPSVSHNYQNRSPVNTSETNKMFLKDQLVPNDFLSLIESGRKDMNKLQRDNINTFERTTPIETHLTNANNPENFKSHRGFKKSYNSCNLNKMMMMQNEESKPDDNAETNPPKRNRRILKFLNCFRSK